MSIASLAGIEITDADIDEIEILLGGVKFDKQRRDIIRCMDTVDIQAFPGSGKTTVLIAKLAILAKKWPYTDKGICVLSHTNVARDEIETRLGNADVGKSLLSYPHFVGTVHSFFDTFVGLPWLRSNGYPITLIDRELVLERRFHRLSYKTKQYLSHKKLSEYACESESFPISISIGCTQNAPSYKDIVDCIKCSFREGYFTFNEILQISKYVIEHCKYLPPAIQARFPVLFVDEAQDTNGMQWKLIDSSFPDSNFSICQSFGDANQAIYQSYGMDDTSNIFPSERYLTMSNSHRFGQSIAHLADPLGAIVQGLDGDFSMFDRLKNKHTIFLFDDATAVLPAYAEHLLSCFSDNEINGDIDCYAVGMVHNKDRVEITDKQYPIGIKDYWPTYDPEASKLTYKPQHFIEFFQIGQSLFKQKGDYYFLVENVAEGFRRYIKLNTNFNISDTGKAFNSIMKLISENDKSAFRTDLSRLIKLPIDTQEAWRNASRSAQSILNIYFGIDNFKSDFFRWISNSETKVSRKNKDAPDKNVFVYKNYDTNRIVQIKLSSIHAVKGRTHLATLVLDTYWYERNIKSIMPWLYNEPAKKRIGKRDLTRLKCHYVALTRARGLICIAALKSSVSDEDKRLLSKIGWNIVEL